MEENINPITEKEGIFDNSNVLKKAFVWMFMGLLATGIIAVYTYKSDFWMDFAMRGGFQILAIVELVVVVVFSLISRKLPPAVVGALYFIYAAINGVTMASIFYVYTLGSILTAFFGAAIMFGIFAAIGYFTKMDLTKFSTLFFGLLIAGIIVSVINLFIGSTMVEIVLSWAMLILFFAITAYDIQKMRALSEVQGIYQDKLHIYAAMDLYLDFINIFIRLLRLFGKRK